MKAWESKNAKNAAKAGGVSLMALSLAACGGSSETVDITSDNAAAIVAALTTEAGVTHATVDAAVAAGIASVDITSDNAALIAAAVEAVDTTTDDAAAVSLALRNAAADAGVTGTSTMTNAELITAIKTANDATIAAGVDLTTDNATAIDAAVVALGIDGITTLAGLNTAYDLLANPTVTSFTLKSTTDTLPGTDSADTFKSVIVGNQATGSTLTAGDSIAASGGEDTLEVAITGALSGDLTVTVDVDVEKLLVNNHDTSNDNNIFDALLMDGLTTVGATSSAATGDTIFSNATTVTNVVMNNGAGDVTVKFTDKAVESTEDSISLAVNGQTGGTFKVQGATTGGVETINVTASGSASDMTIDGNNVTSVVNVSGAGDLTATLSSSALKTVNAADAAGKLDVTTNVSGNLTITGGAGDDKITFSGTSYTKDDVVDGGDGDDTLEIDAVGSAADLKNVSNVETIEVLTTGGITIAEDVSVMNFDMTSTGTNALTLSAGVKSAVTAEIGATGADTVVNTADVTLTIDGLAAAFTDAGTITGGTTATDTLNITADTNSDAAILLSSSGVVTKVEQINVLDNGDNAISAAKGAAGKDVSITTGAYATALNIDASALDAAISDDDANDKINDSDESAEILTVDGSSATAALTITGGAAGDSITGGTKNDVIDGGAGNDTITMTAAGDDNVSGGAGDDTILFGNTLTKADVVDGGDGEDILSVTSLTAADLAGVTNVETLQYTGTTTLSADLSFDTIDLSKDTNADSVTFATGYTNATTVKVDQGDTVVNTGADIVLTVTGTAADFDGTGSATTVTGSDKAGVTNSMTITADSTADSTADVVTSGNITNIDAITVTDAGDAATGATAAGKDIEIDLASYGTALTIDASGLDAGTADADADGKFGDDTDAEQLIITGTSGKALTVTGGDADDTIVGSSDSAAGDTLKGGAGEDTFTMAGNLAYTDTVDGGDGADTMSLDSSTAIGDVAFMNVSNVENITMADTTADLTLGAYASAAKIAKVTVDSGNGNDVVNAAGMTTGIEIVGSTTTAGDDTLTGGVADDTFTFSGTAALEDSDKIVGGDGTDTISINNSAGAVTVGTDTSNGLKVSDTAGAGVISGVEQFVVKDADGGDTAGSEDADLIKVFFGDTSSAAAYNTIVDGSVLTDANDAMTVDASSVTDAKFNTTFTVTGGAGKDTLIGGDGADTLKGGANDDAITGGVGADTLTGGAGADDFIYALGSAQSTSAKTDTITDFTTASDEVRISLTAAAGATTYDFTDKGTVVSASDAMTKMSSVIGQYVYNSTDGTIVVDVDGNGMIQSTDFVLSMAAYADGDIAFDITTLTTADTVTTGAGNDTFDSAVAGDSITAGAGDDKVTLNNVTYTGTFAMGTGTDTAIVKLDADVKGATVSGLEVIEIASTKTLVVSNAQAATFNSTDGMTITGVASGNAETVNVAVDGAQSTLSVAGIDTTDVSFNFNIDNAKDAFTGDDGVDTFVYSSAATAINSNAAMVLNGGSGTDVLFIDTTGASDLKAATFTSIETLDLQTGADDVAVTMTAAQINSFTTISAAATDKLTATTIDGATLAGTAAIDTFDFNSGDKGVTITGFSISSEADVIDVIGLDAGTYALLNAANDGTITQTTATDAIAQGSGITVADNKAILVEVVDGATVDTAADIVTALVDTGVLDAIDITQGTDNTALLVVGEATTGDTVYIYKFTDDAVATTVDIGEIELIATVTESADFINDLVAGNFDFA